MDWPARNVFTNSLLPGGNFTGYWLNQLRFKFSQSPAGIGAHYYFFGEQQQHHLRPAGNFDLANDQCLFRDDYRNWCGR
jgi:hypothetical protein